MAAEGSDRLGCRNEERSLVEFQECCDRRRIEVVAVKVSSESYVDALPFAGSMFEPGASFERHCLITRDSFAEKGIDEQRDGAIGDRKAFIRQVGHPEISSSLCSG